MTQIHDLQQKMTFRNTHIGLIAIYMHEHAYKQFET